ncbi:hypothetical protein LNKW23_06810 [Paralimibaculum aggregatum]|uniref:DUF4214 domain-containing protein n=1 Tax=Paralimibaculum aggregatum TaxID=3036245 RepID=A0ABQ6LDN2_9RHOB|nr:Ig-like domain-containing protein [Limibaculum sp. NKW23]GMG81468.1 hypothetical protein LNKW23_06810 [Limibaculum sp. NKW23]
MATFTVTTNTDIVDAADGVLSLREAIVMANASVGPDLIDVSLAELGEDTRLELGSVLVIQDDLVIDGLGVFSVAAAPDSGAQLFRVDPGVASVVFQGISLSGGSTAGGGGAVEALDPGGNTLLVFELAELTGNVSTGPTGGGAVRTAGNVEVRGSVFAENAAVGDGGAIIAGGDVEISDSAFISNSTTGGSGGAVSAGGSVIGMSSLFEANLAESENGSGGALFGNEQAIAADSEFTNNLAGNEGGAIAASGAFVERSLFAGNASGQRGGAIAAALAEITDSTFAANVTSGTGGAISAEELLLGRASLSGNEAIGGGGGIDVSLVAIISGSLVLGNISAEPGLGEINLGSDPELVFEEPSIVGAIPGHFEADAFDGVENADPGLVFDEIGVSGGVVFGLLSQSPAESAALALRRLVTNPALDRAPALPGQTDARGEMRSVDYPDAAGGAIDITDIGAFELQDDLRPTARNDALAASEGVANALDVLGNDSDRLGEPVLLQSVTVPGLGAVSISGDTLLYTPNPGSAGSSDSFTYTVIDGAGLTDTATVSITIAPPPNMAPTVVNDAAIVAPGGEILIPALANDTDPEGDFLTYSAFGQPLFGTVDAPGPDIRYVADPGYNGIDLVNYTVTDGQGGFDEGFVFVFAYDLDADILDPIEFVTFGDGTFDTLGHKFLPGLAGEVFEPDVALGGMPVPAFFSDLQAGVAGGTGPDGVFEASLAFGGQDRFDYAFVAPAPLPPAEETFSLVYSVTDSADPGRSAFGVARIVSSTDAGNAVPEAVDDAALAVAGSPVVIDVLANDSDPDGDPLGLSIVDAPASGTAEIVDGAITYTPDAGAGGSDGFLYAIDDGAGGIAIAAVAISIGQVTANTPPVAVDDRFAVAGDAPPTALDVLRNDSDPDDDPLSAALPAAASAAGGTLQISGGELLYTPPPGFVGIDSFTYTAADGQGGETDAGATVVVTDPSCAAVAGSGDGDEIPAGAGNECIDGGAGRDTVVFAGSRDASERGFLPDGDVAFSSAANGTDTLTDIERAAFDDGTLIFDAAGADLGYIYRTYAAAFARTPDEGGFIFWNDAINTGAFSRAGVAQFFVDSPEFAEKFGEDPSDADFIDALFNNVLLRDPDDGGRTFWLDAFETGLFDRADMLVFFAESPENVARNIDNLDVGIWVV